MNVPPPLRSVSLPARLWLRVGTPLALLGWVLLGLGSAVFWSSGGQTLVYTLAHLQGETARTQAQVVAVLGGGARVLGRRNNGYRYLYAVDGREYIHTLRTHRKSWRRGESLAIEYARGAPARSLPVGLARRPVWFAWLTLAAGLLVLYFAWRRGARLGTSAQDPAQPVPTEPHALRLGARGRVRAQPFTATFGLGLPLALLVANLWFAWNLLA